ncbi:MULTISPECIES: DUF4041 domain-containing protein [Idiomarina]|uniref:DUF4041 domain-containing protein n=1 Tax=Idiomarinaceae TaxID=267893 RepID=UPI00129CE6F7|nr:MULTISPECIES: DUF4041 domain-containing protein [Idiomarina]MRJ43243.1 DUF4041 domain-containing protein [Idiomarina sp. FeN1]NCU57348.1 DUF4041 domain-containing protein [Idiomarina sp. FenA--70]NCU61455.1 DUF4041 domain-containing protein [Idiomarina sp. FenBw--71]UUN14716.1 DUF4041 domain-containing protein [Idiomarina loihiensis]
MEVLLILLNAIAVIFIYRSLSRRVDNKIESFGNLKNAVAEYEERRQRLEEVLKEHTTSIRQKELELDKLLSEVNVVKDKLSNAQYELTAVDRETKALQELRHREQDLEQAIEKLILDQTNIKTEITSLQEKRLEKESELHEVMSKVDLYSRIEEFVDFGHFEMPEYLFQTGERYAAEIKLVREQQKQLIKDKQAIRIEGKLTDSGVVSIDKSIIDGQIKLLLKAFNTECDMLIGKVSPATFERTLSQIEKLANDLEKSVASKRCGFNNDYVELKFQECRIQYEYSLKKKDELEEQRLIREQMREEAKAEREYREALAAAEREEKLYRELLEKARQELTGLSQEERALAEAKIAALEQQLAEAEAKEQRVKSLAEQTRRGHVYVISNVGSFGENVYKIGMTRRLDPMDRVRELGDASVPFSFDVHAIIFADDAPALETALHREFSQHRVNAVNLRKEFFNVELARIRHAVHQIGGVDVDFRTTIAAEEYFESKRLREQFVTS